jgi:hypothetical protein
MISEAWQCHNIWQNDTKQNGKSEWHKHEKISNKHYVILIIVIKKSNIQQNDTKQKNI